MIKNIAVLLAVAGLLMIFLPVISGFQERENLNELAADYVDGSIHDLGTPNVVTSVIVTYRGLDTLGEVTVLFLATVGVGLLLKGRKEDMLRISSSELLETTSSVLVAMIMILGVYIFTHGHLTPGGGFQGGVIFGSSLILLAISYDLKTLVRRIKEKVLGIYAALGVLIYVGIGAICMPMGGNFLDYSKLA
ncbi:MAG: sodium:proton antiporter, partial [Candidatus Sabulitectum sp.]|nr:sodium:proton antiporter [Candidatus Sabulitectum sp.]